MGEGTTAYSSANDPILSLELTWKWNGGHLSSRRVERPTCRSSRSGRCFVRQTRRKRNDGRTVETRLGGTRLKEGELEEVREYQIPKSGELGKLDFLHEMEIETADMES